MDATYVLLILGSVDYGCGHEIFKIKNTDINIITRL